MRNNTPKRSLSDIIKKEIDLFIVPSSFIRDTYQDLRNRRTIGENKFLAYTISSLLETGRLGLYGLAIYRIFDYN